MTKTPHMKQSCSTELALRALLLALVAALGRLAIAVATAVCLVVLLLHEVAAALVYAIASMLAWFSF